MLRRILDPLVFWWCRRELARVSKDEPGTSIEVVQWRRIKDWERAKNNLAASAIKSGWDSPKDKRIVVQMALAIQGLSLVRNDITMTVFKQAKPVYPDVADAVVGALESYLNTPVVVVDAVEPDPVWRSICH